MSHRNSEDQLRKLRDKCLLFNQFMVSKANLPKQIVEAYEDSSRSIDRAFSEGDTRGLRAMSADIDNQILRHIPLKMAMELKRIFEERLGIQLEVVYKRQAKFIQSIIRRGEIVDAEEYELILNYVESVFNHPEKKDEIERANDLLVAYLSRSNFDL